MISKPVLVTGGAGFIGGHLVNYLTDLQIPSIVIDNLSTGTLDNLPTNSPYCRFIEADVNDAGIVAKAVQFSALVIHLAAVVGMQNVVKNPIKTLETNIDAVRGIAESCAKHSVPLVNISSSAVYHSRDPLANGAFKEGDLVHSGGLHPSSTYAESKAIAELICNTYYRSLGLKCLIVRPFNLIGPRQTSDYGMVVPRFVRLALQGKPLTIHGDGCQTRAFSDVRQAVRLLWALISKTSWNCQIVNLATNDRAISIRQLARLVCRSVGVSSKRCFLDYEAVFGSGYVDIRSRKPSLTLLKQLVGEWTPIPLSETIASIVEYESRQMDIGAEASIDR